MNRLVEGKALAVKTYQAIDDWPIFYRFLKKKKENRLHFFRLLVQYIFFINYDYTNDCKKGSRRSMPQYF